MHIPHPSFQFIEILLVRVRAYDNVKPKNCFLILFKLKEWIGLGTWDLHPNYLLPFRPSKTYGIVKAHIFLVSSLTFFCDFPKMKATLYY